MAHHGFEARMLVGVGNMFSSVMFFVIQGVVNWRSKKPSLINTSYFWDQNTGKFQWWLVVAIVSDSAMSVVGAYFMILSFKYALYAEMNQGVITTLFSFTSVFLSFFAWIIFREKINIYHIIGMAAMIG